MCADHSPLRIELVGFDERHRAVLDVLFQGLGRGSCVVVGHDKAEAAIIDVDRLGGLAGWERYHRANPEQPTAIVSIYDRNRIASEVFLKKPVKADDMLHAVAALRARRPDGESTATGPTRRVSGPAGPRRTPAQASAGAAPGSATHAHTPDAGPDPAPAPESLTTTRRPFGVAARSAAASSRVPAAGHPIRSPAAERGAGADPATFARQAAAAPQPGVSAEERALCGAEPDIDCTNPRAVAARSFDAEHSFYAALRATIRRATRDRCHYLLSHDGKAVLGADGEREEVILVLPKHELRRLCALEGAARNITIRRVPQPVAAGSASTVESVLWEMALWTYRGRLPAGTDPSARVKLRRWPNFTRLTPIPHGMRIAALLSQQALTLPFVAQALNIPQRHVFAFYGAAHELGIAEPIRRQGAAADAAPAAIAAPARDGLIARLRRVFRHAG